VKLKVSVSYIKLRATALAKRMTVAVGEFIATILKFDTASASDQFSKRPGKRPSDSARFTDSLYWIPTKVITTRGAFFDGGDPPYFLQDYVVGAPDNQTYTLVGGFIKDIAKVLQETPATSEVVAKAFARSINDGMFVTDDVNGAAAGDDQITQYFKVTSELTQITDAVSKRPLKAFTDSFATTSSGSLSIQNYTIDMTYFLEDYVGIGRNWSYGRRAFETSSSVSSSGVLFIQDYAASSYFSEDYVGISRSFT